MTTPAQERDPRLVALPAADIRRRFVEFFAERGHTVVPSASLVPAGDQTLLFTNSGMVQFKDALTGAEKRSYVRAVDYQRCLRVAGKHNDFEEVGRTPRHHTFFEMLGNFSFGDYFKRDAIRFAWDFLTRDLGIPAERLAATVYSTDDDAYGYWRDDIGLPAERIARWGDFPTGDEKNWWRMADVGPCGPCSEIHYDRGAELSEGPHCVPDHSEHCPRWLEIWNLVFMQYELAPDRSLTPLPAPGVDTGMGLERLASVMQGVASNYDTDLFAPIHERMRTLLGHDPEAFEAERFSYQVIADHARAMTFLVADGVLPANDGRGYVLRRIVRRAVRHGRLLGRRAPFLAETATVVIDTMREAYTHLAERRSEILEAIEREEGQFSRTLEAGSKLLAGALAGLPTLERIIGRRAEDLPADAPVLDGDVAFRLHDTFGFPIDLTIELAAESGVSVDRPGFETALAAQRERSRSGTRAQLARHAERTAVLTAISARTGETPFLGYETTRVEDARIAAILRDGIEVEAVVPGDDVVEVVLDRTPFYAEAGGQVGDQGRLHDPDGAPLLAVADTQRPLPGLVVHAGTVDGRLRVGDSVIAEVDAARRADTMRNHTGTHLLHRALRNVVGERARQAGSLVHPDHLRFDYPFERGLSDDEKRAIEDEVRRVVREDRPVTIAFMSMAEAIERGADAFFDEKYGETVRTIRVEDYSFELCGGTHCRASGQVGSFVITGERSIGSGMRRIEALTGRGADAWLRARSEALEAAAASVGALSVEALGERIGSLQADLRDLRRRIRERGAGAVPKPGDLRDRVETIGGLTLLTLTAPFESTEAMKGYARDLRTAIGSNAIVVGRDADEPEIFATLDTAGIERGLSAGELIRAAAPAIDGRGGGRPEMAQAKGTRRDGLAAAMDQVRAAIRRATGG
jgi:alanyl-tRNA synthetase